MRVLALSPFLWPFTFSTFKCRWFSHLLNIKWSHDGLSPKGDLSMVLDSETQFSEYYETDFHVFTLQELNKPYSVTYIQMKHQGWWVLWQYMTVAPLCISLQAEKDCKQIADFSALYA